jgi:hypothetical protein
VFTNSSSTPVPDIELVLVGVPQPQDLPERAVERLGVQGPSGGELGAGIEQALHDHRHAKLPSAAGLGGEQGVETEAAQRAERGGDGAVGAGAQDLEGILEGRGWRRLALEDLAEGLDALGRPVGEVGEGAVLDLRAFAEALAQEDRRGGAAVGDGDHVHDFIMKSPSKGVKSPYIPTRWAVKRPHPWEPSPLANYAPPELRPSRLLERPALKPHARAREDGMPSASTSFTTASSIATTNARPRASTSFSDGVIREFRG